MRSFLLYNCTSRIKSGTLDLDLKKVVPKLLACFPIVFLQQAKSLGGIETKIVDLGGT